MVEKVAGGRHSLQLFDILRLFSVLDSARNISSLFPFSLKFSHSSTDNLSLSNFPFLQLTSFSSINLDTHFISDHLYSSCFFFSLLSTLSSSLTSNLLSSFSFSFLQALFLSLSISLLSSLSLSSDFILSIILSSFSSFFSNSDRSNSFSSPLLGMVPALLFLHFFQRFSFTDFISNFLSLSSSAKNFSLSINGSASRAKTILSFITPFSNFLLSLSHFFNLSTFLSSSRFFCFRASFLSVHSDVFSLK